MIRPSLGITILLTITTLALGSPFNGNAALAQEAQIASVESVVQQPIRKISPDHAQDSLYSVSGLAGGKGLLEFHIDRPATKPDWIITVQIGSGPAVQISSHQLGAQPKFQAPFSTAGEVYVTFSVDAPDQLSIVAVRYFDQLFDNQYKVGLLKLNNLATECARPNKPITGSFASGADARQCKLSTAVAQLAFVDNQGAGLCTAFQFIPGYFLTNAHCVTGKSDFKLSFDDNPDWSLPTTGFDAIPIYPKPSDPRPRADYAILYATPEASYRDRVLPLASAQAVQHLPPHQRLELYEYWMGGPSAPPETYMNGRSLALQGCKLKTPEADCVVTGQSDNLSCTETAGADELVHFCGTDQASSGSPIVLSGGTHVIALHHLGCVEGASNCAVRVDAIISDIKKNQTTIGRPDLITALGVEVHSADDESK